jgi:transcriptional regulator with XRE-family HTH domain
VELSLKRGKTSLSVLKAENREIEALHTPHVYWTKGLQVRFGSDKAGPAREVDIGGRIRALRTKRGLSQTELARLVGVTPSNISQVEGSQIYPSITALMKMAEILSVEISAFFRESAADARQSVFRASDTAEVQLPDMPGESILAWQLTPLDLEARCEAYLIEILPGKSLPSHFFIHKGEEFGYLLSGKLHVKFDSAASTLHSGDAVSLTTEMPSQWKNPGATPARLLWLKIR